MARLENPGKGEIAVLSDDTAIICAVRDDGGVAGRVERRAAGIWDLERDGFGTNPCIPLLA